MRKKIMRPDSLHTAWASGLIGSALAACAALPAHALAQTAPPALLDNTATRQATAASPERPGSQLVDGIAAVIDKDVITLREVRLRSQQMQAELARQGISAPPEAQLQRQVLQRLISERIEDLEAARLNIRVDDEQVSAAIQSIAARNKLSVAQMRAQIETNTSWDEYRRTLRRDILRDRLRQRAVDHTLIISDAEIDAFLKEQQAQRAGSASRPAQAATQVALAQILVRVPEGASSEQVAALREKAEALLARARAGSDFAALAAADSDGPEALEGGALGARALDAWPDLFAQAVAERAAGEVSDLIQSGNGFHILKVLERSNGEAPWAEAQSPVPVTQTQARHILIKTSAVVNDEQARQRLAQLRQRILAGESFADLARRFSADATAPQGGDLGWLNPGETVPAFEQTLDALAEGEISEPVQSPFGWHLIEVQARRVQDMAGELLRMQARQTLFERRAQPAFENWLAQLHDQAYIDNRLEKREQLEASL